MLASERPPDDVPLHRVGVLELVDEHDPVTAPQPIARQRTADRVGQGLLQADQQVVVGEEVGVEQA